MEKDRFVWKCTSLNLNGGEFVIMSGCALKGPIVLEHKILSTLKTIRNVMNRSFKFFNKSRHFTQIYSDSEAAGEAVDKMLTQDAFGAQQSLG